MHLKLFLILNTVATMTSGTSLSKVQAVKEKLLYKGLKRMLGSDIELSDSEIKANQIIMDLKTEVVEHGLLYPENFTLANHFFEYNEQVRNTKLFKLLQKMPKGALLHVHDTGILKADYMVQLTYLDNLYVCFDGDQVEFLFSKELPDDKTHVCGSKWELMRDARHSSGDVEKFDANLKRHFTLLTENPGEVHTDVNTVWQQFQQIFITSGPLVTYKPVWEKYFYDSLKALRDDGVMFLEVRSVLPPLYDLEGNVYDPVETAVSYKKVLDQFKAEYPDFFGAKLIYAPLRLVDNEAFEEYKRIAREIKEKMPDFLAGFDLVGQEDLGETLETFLPELFEISKEFDLYLHAGETNWNGLTDENLYDAIALGTKRIGHGYAIIKHPTLMDEIRKRDIPLEVNVISNAVLKLVADVRNHPLANWLAQSFPVVLSSDDPGLWESEPLTHDFYLTFVAVANRRADLKLLKKLALNSLYYSSCSQKDKLVHNFEIQWTKFIDSLVRNNW